MIIILNIEDMMRIFIPFLLISLIYADCPLNYYPRMTTTGIIEAHLNNDPTQHARKINFDQAVDAGLSDGGIQAALAITGFQFNSNQIVDFNVNFVHGSTTKKLSFTVEVNNPLNGWRSLKFNYFVTSNPQFQAQSLSLTEFSTGLSTEKYSVYRIIQGFQKFNVDPQIKVFISGLKLKAKPTNSQYSTVLNQYENFKRFSANSQLVGYFAQIVEEKKALSFDMTVVKLLGRVLTINFQTNTQIKGLQLSYILFNQQNFNKKHSFISGDFDLINGGEQKFTPLQNMDMIFVGMNQFKAPRDSFISISLNINNFLSQASFNLETNFAFFAVGYTYIAFQMKQQYVCEDCVKSPNIYQNRFCVEQCPRGYSQIKRFDVTYCDICSMDKLKVIDPLSSQCVCANRHYLDTVEDTCKPCRYDCMSCDSSSRCLTCDNSLLQTKRKLSSIGRCECPAVGFYDDLNAENIVCQKCSPKCLTCDGSRDFDCLTCAVGKQLDFRGFCVCKNGFVEDATGNCVCVPPRTLSNNVCIDTKTPCGPNQIQQFIDLTKRCVCQSGYQPVLNDCIKCGINSVFNAQDLTCKCINNTVKINNECISCQLNTIFDPITGNCICRNGTFKADDGTCVTCPPRKAYINGKCQCIFNYFENKQGDCQRCGRETDGVKCPKNFIVI